ncbi:MAG: hypothetical protein KBT31_01130 [Firmicutes bacterium]|nr:hypothetical protein [Candidatus Colimorpha enterica]
MLKADFTKINGVINPVHGVNNGPRTGHFLHDSSKWFKEAQIPYSRLHDTEGAYGAGEFVDIPCVFKCFDADPTDPKNYNFFLTDKYIEAIRECGTNVIYRLGVTIENGPIKRHIYPPKDYKKWARICEGVIAHYCEGWADGYKDAVEYFEIWNEPEFTHHMWEGTFEEFYPLFKDTIIYLKKRFPNVKIGGPAGGFTSDEFIKGFFEYMNEGEKAPLDFLSYHNYFDSLDTIGREYKRVQDTLKKYGRYGIPTFITEWNYVQDWENMKQTYEIFNDVRGASFVAAAFCEMQRVGVNIANYYDAQFNSSFNGLFRRNDGKYRHDEAYGSAIKPAFRPFIAFNKVYQLKNQVETVDEPKIKLAAATDGKKDAIFIGRFDDSEGAREEEFTLDVSGMGSKNVKLTLLSPDGESTEETFLPAVPSKIALRPYTFALIEAER